MDGTKIIAVSCANVALRDGDLILWRSKETRALIAMLKVWVSMAIFSMLLLGQRNELFLKESTFFYSAW